MIKFTDYLEPIAAWLASGAPMVFLPSPAKLAARLTGTPGDVLEAIELDPRGDVRRLLVRYRATQQAAAIVSLARLPDHETEASIKRLAGVNAVERDRDLTAFLVWAVVLELAVEQDRKRQRRNTRRPHQWPARSALSMASAGVSR